MGTLISLIKSISIIDGWVQMFLSAYISHNIDKLEGDTRDLQVKRSALFNSIKSAKNDLERKSLSVMLKDLIVNGTLLVVILLGVSSCVHTTASSYLKRPIVVPSIANSCTGELAGQTVDITNNLCGTTEEQDVLLKYLEDIENRLYVCIHWPKRCK